MGRISLDEQLAKTQLRLDQLKTRKEDRERRQLAADKARQRKVDMRRKIIVGGHLLKLVASGDADANRLYDRILSQLSERDEAIFGGPTDPNGTDPSVTHEQLLAQYVPIPTSSDVAGWTAYVRNRAHLVLKIQELGESDWDKAAADRFREAVKQWEAATGGKFSTDLLEGVEHDA